MADRETIRANLAAVRHRMAEAASRAGRSPEEIELLAVSKTFSPDVLMEAMRAGLRTFAENKVQELLAKAPVLPDTLSWHLIGHLQSNKVRKVIAVTEAIHSVDSIELARDIERIADEVGVFPEVYLQVNVAADGRKHGFTPESVAAVVEEMVSMHRMTVVGLMTIPPLDPVPENSRRHFAALRELRDQLEAQTGIPLPGLSMGMSGDFEIAIEEGATIVRVGSALFGARSADEADE